MEFPLRDCDTCIHNRVCKYVESLQSIAGSDILPIDFSTSSCKEYYADPDPEVPDVPIPGMKDAGYVVGDTFLDAVNQAVATFLGKGLTPRYLYVNRSTLNALLEETKAAGKEYEVINDDTVDIYTDNGWMCMLYTSEIGEGQIGVGVMEDDPANDSDV